MSCPFSAELNQGMYTRTPTAFEAKGANNLLWIWITTAAIIWEEEQEVTWQLDQPIQRDEPGADTWRDHACAHQKKIPHATQLHLFQRLPIKFIMMFTSTSLWFIGTSICRYRWLSIIHDRLKQLYILGIIFQSSSFQVKLAVIFYVRNLFSNYFLAHWTETYLFLTITEVRWLYRINKYVPVLQIRSVRPFLQDPYTKFYS